MSSEQVRHNKSIVPLESIQKNKAPSKLLIVNKPFNSKCPETPETKSAAYFTVTGTETCNIDDINWSIFRDDIHSTSIFLKTPQMFSIRLRIVEAAITRNYLYLLHIIFLKPISCICLWCLTFHLHKFNFFLVSHVSNLSIQIFH